MRVKIMALMVITTLVNLYAIDSTIGRISHLKGEVYIQRGSELGFESATINFPVTGGDRIATTDGMAEVYIGNSNYLRLDKDTKIDVLSLPDKREETVLRLWAGNLYLSINKLNMERDIEVQTDDVTIFILQPGLFRINTFERNCAEVLVIKGAVEVRGFNGKAIVRSNQSLSWENGELERVRTFYSSNFDEFDDFNESRESLIKRTRVQRYLPSELYDYEWELTTYGRWHYLAPYGWVWLPPYVFTGWRPYYWGRWVWYPWGWTWVPYEPWGWVTFHFGRWHWHFSIGWYWVPTTVWGPAWVHWTWGDYWVGWCPIDIYNRPVIIINNYWVTHYHDHAPANSSSFVFIRKDQIMAPDVRRAVLEKEKISQLGTVPIFKSQPNFKPTSLSPVVESYKGKIMLKNQPPVLNEENISPKAVSRERIRVETPFSSEERGAVSSKSRVERKYEPENRGSFIKLKEKTEIGKEGIFEREGRVSPSYEKDFRSIERKERLEPFYNIEKSERNREIRTIPREERPPSGNFSPFSKRESYQRSSYNEERRSSSIRDVFKPFSGGSGSSSSRSSGPSGAVFKAPSPPKQSSSSSSPSGGRVIKRKND